MCVHSFSSADSSSRNADKRRKIRQQTSAPELVTFKTTKFLHELLSLNLVWLHGLVWCALWNIICCSTKLKGTARRDVSLRWHGRDVSSTCRGSFGFPSVSRRLYAPEVPNRTKASSWVKIFPRYSALQLKNIIWNKKFLLLGFLDDVAATDRHELNRVVQSPCNQREGLVVHPVLCLHISCS